MLKITIVSIPVLDQEKALQFYRDILDFDVVHDIPLGGGNRWLTLKSKLQDNGPELLLEPAPLHFAPFVPPAGYDLRCCPRHDPSHPHPLLGQR